MSVENAFEMIMYDIMRDNLKKMIIITYDYSPTVLNELLGKVDEENIRELEIIVIAAKKEEGDLKEGALDEIRKFVENSRYREILVNEEEFKIHGKVYVLIGERKVFIHVGSANFTHAGLHGNFEIMYRREANIRDPRILRNLGALHDVKDCVDDIFCAEVLDLVNKLLRAVSKQGNSSSQSVTIGYQLNNMFFMSDELVYTDIHDLKSREVVFLHSMGKNSLKKVFLRLLEDICKKSDEGTIEITYVTPYHSEWSIEKFAKMIHEVLRGKRIRLHIVSNNFDSFEDYYSYNPSGDRLYTSRIKSLKERLVSPNGLVFEFEFFAWRGEAFKGNIKAEMQELSEIKKRFIHAKIIHVRCKNNSGEVSSFTLVTSANITSSIWREKVPNVLEVGVLDLRGLMKKEQKEVEGDWNKFIDYLKDPIFGEKISDKNLEGVPIKVPSRGFRGYITHKGSDIKILDRKILLADLLQCENSKLKIKLREYSPKVFKPVIEFFIRDLSKDPLAGYYSKRIVGEYDEDEHVITFDISGLLEELPPRKRDHVIENFVLRDDESLWVSPDRYISRRYIYSDENSESGFVRILGNKVCIHLENCEDLIDWVRSYREKCNFSVVIIRKRSRNKKRSLESKHCRIIGEKEIIGEFSENINPDEILGIILRAYLKDENSKRPQILYIPRIRPQFILEENAIELDEKEVCVIRAKEKSDLKFLKLTYKVSEYIDPPLDFVRVFTDDGKEFKKLGVRMRGCWREEIYYPTSEVKDGDSLHIVVEYPYRRYFENVSVSLKCPSDLKEPSVTYYLKDPIFLINRDLVEDELLKREDLIFDKDVKFLVELQELQDLYKEEIPWEIIKDNISSNDEGTDIVIVVKKEIFDRLIGSLGLNGDNLSVKPLYEFSLRTFGYSKPQIFDLRKRKVIKGVKPGYVIHIRALFEVKGHKFLDGTFLLSEWKEIPVRKEIMDFDVEKGTVKELKFSDLRVPLENEYIKIRGAHLLATSFLTEYDPQSFLPLILINSEPVRLIRIKFRRGSKLIKTKKNFVALIIPILPILLCDGDFTVRILLCPRSKDIIAKYGPLARKYRFYVHDQKIGRKNLSGGIDVQMKLPEELLTEIKIKSMSALYGRHSLEIVTGNKGRKLERYKDKDYIHECGFLIEFKKLNSESGLIKLYIKKTPASRQLCAIYCYNVE